MTKLGQIVTKPSPALWNLPSWKINSTKVNNTLNKFALLYTPEMPLKILWLTQDLSKVCWNKLKQISKNVDAGRVFVEYQDLEESSF